MAITEQEEFEFRRRAELEQAMRAQAKAPNEEEEFEFRRRAELERPALPDRTIGQSVQDVGAGLLTGLGKVGQFPGQLYGLATGDFTPGVLTQNAKALEVAGAHLESPQLKAAKVERDTAVQETAKTGEWEAFKTTFSRTVSNPALITNFLAETAPQLIPSFGAARAVSLAMAGKKALTGEAKEAAAKKAGAAGTAAAIGTGATQQGADIGAQTFEDISKHLEKNGMSKEEAAAASIGYARATGAGAAVISLLAQKLPGAKRMEEAFAGVPGAQKGVIGRFVSAGKTGVGEAGSEVVEETGGKLLQNVAMQQEAPETQLTAGLGQTAAMAALGGAGMGAGVGAISPSAAPPVAPLVAPPGTPPTGEPPITEVPPTTEVPPETPPETPTTTAPSIGNYHEGDITPLAPVFTQLQTKAEQQDVIAQMESVAANPDYSLLGKSDNTETGAPVIISDFKIPKELMGNVEDIKDESGKDIKAQYAVLEAGEILTANTLEGAPNADYTNTEEKGTRAIYGNNRITGLQAAYDNGTATSYTPALLNDTTHGIDPAVIAGMDRPVLVRVIPKSTLLPQEAETIDEAPLDTTDFTGESKAISEEKFGEQLGAEVDQGPTWVSQSPGLMSKRSPELSAAVSNKDVPTVIQHLQKSKNPVVRMVSELASKAPDFTISLFAGTPYSRRKNAVGLYANNQVFLKNQITASNEDTVAHEIVHHLTVSAINQPTPEQLPAIARLDKLFLHVKKVLKEEGRVPTVGKKKAYGLKNTKEFLSEGMSNPAFQYELRKIKYQNTTAWGAFTRIVGQILGIKNDTALSELIAITEEISAQQNKKSAASFNEAPVASTKTNRPGTEMNKTEDIATSKWDAPKDSQLDRIIEKLQNKLLPLKRVQESIKKSGAEILDKNNPYQQEELYHNRTSKRVDDFISKELNPLLEEMKKRGVTLDQVEEYLQARHAEEANRVIAERNPDDTELQDGGSGMNTADAKKYLDGLSKSERERLSAVAKKVDAILESTRNIYVSEKLVSKAQMSSWKNMFKHYIPLMREDKDGAMGVGQGYSIRGKEARNRTGSKAKVIDIIANIAMQREKAIGRSEKNRVGKALVGLVELNPNPDFWVMNKVPTERVLNEKTGLVEERSDPLYRKRDNVITVKIEDSKGEIKEHAVVFNEKNPVALRLASALKNLDATQLEGVMAASASITRYFSAINTQYNPIFGVINLIRDTQGSIINLSSTPLAGKQKEVLSKIVPSLVGIYSAVRNARKGKESTNPYGKLFDELQLEGGMTGYRDLYKDSSDRSKAIKYALDPHAWQKSKLGNIFTAGGRLKVPLAVAQDKAKVIFDWLSDYNLSMEGAARLAVYKTALDNGMSKPQAASLAKNISVNFNRKGLSGQQAGALYAFYNASMQGTARIGETLFTMNNGNIKTLRLNGLGKKIVGGGILLGSMQAIALSLAGFDDDEPPEFIRERNFILPIGGKKYLTLPMPLGFHAIPNIGRITTEFSLGGFKKPGDHVLKLLGVFADAFNPVGNSGLSVQTIAPTPIDPLVALGENRDWTGQPISREDYNKLSPTPGFTRSKDVSSDTSRLLAEAINYLSGGTKYTPGKFSPTADQIDYLAGQVTGGVGREVSKLSKTTKAVSTGEELPPHKIPLVGRFYGDTDTQSSQGAKFYANLKKLNEVEAELKGRIKDRIPATEYRAAHPELRLFPLANRVESNVSELRTLKRKLIEKDAPKEKIKNIETRITVLMKRLNDRVKEHESREK